MEFKLIEATIRHKPILENLLELYAYDLADSAKFDLGDNGYYGYKDLPLYFKEDNRYPYILYIEKKIAGFVFIHKLIDDEIFDMAEFFIMRKYRKME